MVVHLQKWHEWFYVQRDSEDKLVQPGYIHDLLADSQEREYSLLLCWQILTDTKRFVHCCSLPALQGTSCMPCTALHVKARILHACLASSPWMWAMLIL